jgi:hypothetical protein
MVNRTRSTRRSGVTVIGCLLMIILVVIGYYLASGLGSAYFRSYRYKDAMSQEIRFASTRTDFEIKQRLAAAADSIGIPSAGQRVGLKRSGKYIRVWADYDEIIHMPFLIRSFHFHPAAETEF